MVFAIARGRLCSLIAATEVLNQKDLTYCAALGLVAGTAVRVVVDVANLLPAVAAATESSDSSVLSGIAIAAVFGCLYWCSDRYLAQRASARNRLLRIVLVGGEFESRP